MDTTAIILAFSMVPSIQTDVQCLAHNIYHEARDQSDAGKKAVALVTINRANSPRYPQSICEVVYQKYQFSWTIYKPKVDDLDAYNKAYNIALQTYFNYTEDNDGSMLFHKTSIKPDWSYSKKVVKTKIVGKHIFYKYKE